MYILLLLFYQKEPVDAKNALYILNGMILNEKIFKKHLNQSIYENDNWRFLYNHEVYRGFKQPRIAQVIKYYRFRWLENILDVRFQILLKRGDFQE